MDYGFNWMAIATAVVAQTVIGFLWYGPIFGKAWMNFSNMSESDRQAMNTPEGRKKGMRAMLIGLIPSVITMYVLAHILYTYDSVTVMMGIQGAFWIWLGFIATYALNSVLYGKDSMKLYLLNMGYQLVSLMAAGIIISVWR